MKNTLYTLLFIFLLGNLCRLGLPWWSLAPIAALAGWLFARNAWSALAGGFLGGLLLWLSAAWLSDSANGGMLSAKVGQLFMGIQSQHLLWATGLLGALLGALGALTGCWARQMLVQPSKRRNYLQERRR
ncbi:MAG: hypothetical protein ACKVUS_07475 [Saprospiraceae bacterium]